MESNHFNPRISKIVILGTVALIGAVILFISCSKRDDNIVGKWRVVEGRNAGAVFEFTPESRLNIYGGQVQANWYGLPVEKNIPLSTSKYMVNPISSLGMPDEQGDIVWEAKNKLKFWPEKKYSDDEITICSGSLYILTSSTKEKIVVEEMQLTPGKELKKVGEMILIPFKEESQKK